ncbi:MAG: phosphate acyltransferase PlsX, partial [Phenylobacterium sp.]
MTKSLTISIDAMGGDHGPSVVVPGVALAAAEAPALRYLL